MFFCFRFIGPVVSPAINILNESNLISISSTITQNSSLITINAAL